MISLISKTPNLVHWFFPKRVWAFSRSISKVYLTFDDGPIPEITPWVLKQLQKYDACATFFCIGDNIAKYPEIAHQILAEGHTIGNHTFHHKNGWKTSLKEYMEDIKHCKQEIDKLEILNPQSQNKDCNITTEGIGSTREIKNKKPKTLFRPPYGKITSKHAKAVIKKGYKIIMWDVLSVDYDQSVSEEKCLRNVIKNLQKGSIVVFHDSLKAEKNLKYVLPKVLEHIKNKGWRCEAVS